MKWLFGQCQRQKVCLLASGVLSEQEAVEVESHLATCADCRKFYAEIKMTTQPFASWENHFEHIKPRSSAQLRWAKAIESENRSKPIALFSPGFVLLECWRQLVWPSRRTWAGLAAVWVVILVANLNLKASGPGVIATNSSGSADFIMAFRDQELVLAELTEYPKPKAIEPRKQFVPQPRSDRRAEYFTI